MWRTGRWNEAGAGERLGPSGRPPAAGFRAGSAAPKGRAGRRRPGFPASRGGFTLLEVLVVLTILALAGAGASFAWPQITGRLALHRAETAVVALLSEARRTAIETNAATILTFDPATRRLELAGTRAYVLPDGVRLDVTGVAGGGDAARPRILFLGDGSSSGGTLILSDGEATRTVTVSWLTARIAHAR